MTLEFNFKMRARKAQKSLPPIVRGSLKQHWLGNGNKFRVLPNPDEPEPNEE